MPKIFLIVITNLVLLGCALPSGSIIKQGDGSYTLRKEDHAGIFGNMGILKSNVEKEVIEFAKKENKELFILGDNQHPVGIAGDWAWYEMRFKLIDPKQKAEVTACMAQLKTNPSLSIISTKLALGGIQDQTFSMLTNQDFPTEEEKIAISLYGDLKKHCYDLSNKYNTEIGVAAFIIAVDNTTISNLDNILVMLYQGKLTYGDYAKLRKEISDNRDAAIVKIDAELRKNAADTQAQAQMIANQTAIAQAQITQAQAAKIAATASMLQTMKPPPIVVPQTNVIPRINIDCTSNRIGSITATHCH